MKSFHWNYLTGQLVQMITMIVLMTERFYLELPFSVMTDEMIIFIEPVSFYVILIIIMLITW